MNGDSRRLAKTLKPSWVFAVALGSAVGWGAFILPVEWLETAGMTGAVAGFFMAGCLISIVAANFGHIVRVMPVTGGAVAYAVSTMNRTWSFVAGWSMAMGYAGIVALNASAFSLVFRMVFPDFAMQAYLYTVAGWEVYLPEVAASLLVLAIFAIVNIRGAEISGRIQLWSCLLMLAAVVVIFLATGIKFLSGSFREIDFPSGRVNSVGGFFSIVAMAPWAYVGFDNIPQAAGEFRFSARRATSLLLWGVVAATCVYIAMLAATQMAQILAGPEPDAGVWVAGSEISSALGPFGLAMLVLAVSMGVLTGLNGFFLSTSRVFYMMGKLRYLPSQFGTLGARQTPAFATLMVALVCAITPFFGRAALLWVVDMTSMGIAIAYFITCFSSYRIARTGWVEGMSSRLGRDRKQEVIALAGCVISGGFVLLLLIPGSPGVLEPESLFALCVWLMAGICLYAAQYRKFNKLEKQDMLAIIHGQEG